MSQRPSQRIAYQPGTVVKWDDTSNWVCYCTSGVPVGDEPEQPGKECFECTTCNMNWGHVQCYGLAEIHKNKRIWTRCEVLCLECSGDDPNDPPATIPAKGSPISFKNRYNDNRYDFLGFQGTKN